VVRPTPAATPDSLVPEGTAPMAEVEQSTAQDDHRFHYYTTSKVPWAVHAIWLIFWAFSAYYVITYLLPALATEIQSPP
jgi:hypothetical protein